MAFDMATYQKGYYATERGKESRRRALRKYNATPKARAARKAYAKSDHGKAALHRHYLKLNSILRHARKRIAARHLERWPNEPFAVSAADLIALCTKQDGRCALSGIKMTWGQDSVKSTSLSIDRIESSRGYHLDNIRFVCHAINAFRGNGSDVEMVQMAKAIVAYAET